MIRVLAMNDDNHEPSFVLEDGTVYSCASRFICNCLAKSHSEEYDVRMFYICDDFKGTGCEELSDDEVNSLFYCVDCGEDSFGLNFHSAFDILWNASSKSW